MRAKILLGVLFGFFGMLNAQNQVLTRVNGGASWENPQQGTDDQNIANLGLSGTTLTVGIEGGNSQTVNLGSLKDGDAWGVSGENTSGDISRSGRVGIGTAPVDALTVNGGGNAGITIIGNNAGLRSGNNSSFIITKRGASGGLYIRTGNGIDWQNEAGTNTYMNLNSAGDLDLRNDLRLHGEFRDASGDAGTAGQILTSTSTGTNWVSSNFVGAKVEPSSSQSLNTTLRTIPFASVFDAGGNYNPSSSRYIVPSNGYYRIDYHIWVTTTSSTSNNISLVIRGGASGSSTILTSSKNTSGTGVYILSGSTIVNASANNQLHLMMGVGGGTATIASGGSHPSYVAYTKL